jgi:hypothetical protein
MTWSKDQQSAHALDRRAVVVEQPAEHPAKAVMARRWEARRAEAGARRSEPTSSAVLKRSELQGAIQAGWSDQTPAVEFAATERLVEEPQPLAQRTAALSDPLAAAARAERPGWSHDPQRAMLIIASVSVGVLFALLYAGGFLG